jgi:hypothetical protein
MFKEMDKNEDGVLSFVEFREGTRSDKTLLAALEMYNSAPAVESATEEIAAMTVAGGGEAEK